MTIKTNDPQTVLTGKIKQGSQCELITFNFNLGLFQVAFIVNLPTDDEATETKIYAKWKLAPLHRNENENRGQTRQDREEVRDDAAEE